MVKKKSNTSEMRQVSQTILGAGIATDIIPLMSHPCQAEGKIGDMAGFAILGGMTNAAFNAVDNIYSSGKKKKYKL